MLEKYLEQDKRFKYIVNKKNKTNILNNNTMITHKMYGGKYFTNVHFFEKIHGK